MFWIAKTAVRCKVYVRFDSRGITQSEKVAYDVSGLVSIAACIYNHHSQNRDGATGVVGALPLASRPPGTHGGDR